MIRTVCVSVVLLAAVPATAQTITDGSDATVGAEVAAATTALLGKGLKSPAEARYSRLRPGKAGAVCGEVDVTNRMGVHVGPRPFVADTGSGFAGILPDAAEIRHPSSMAQYQGFQRILALLAANCEG
ncbi:MULTISPECIES: hypothetical protein [unclassified Methylobacterium]|uniref:hypothetical protein n=1 Tax=unclassified Methylobacterium TaxID=2615210 RepID=UPI0006FF2602|nr:MULTISPECIES: hypothetical protein [unclassified Methylobacterium]KQO56045.1 hypothetical protein ASF24_19495 [Methylobacterium sp. Leaf86]KQO95969.1 hypothetical protein ASF32_17445 [Methylobacterium sp. Leaf91]MBO1019572.1 hypothetical protein [Methylobacterium sp. SD274]